MRNYDWETSGKQPRGRSRKRREYVTETGWESMELAQRTNQVAANFDINEIVNPQLY